jgi:hypothetical protein
MEAHMDDITYFQQQQNGEYSIKKIVISFKLYGFGGCFWRFHSKQ